MLIKINNFLSSKSGKENPNLAQNFFVLPCRQKATHNPSTEEVEARTACDPGTGKVEMEDTPVLLDTGKYLF